MTEATFSHKSSLASGSFQATRFLASLLKLLRVIIITLGMLLLIIKILGNPGIRVKLYIGSSGSSTTIHCTGLSKAIQLHRRRK